MQKMLEHYKSDTFTGKTFAIWGLAFKPKTDDVREAPALVICEELLRRGAKIQAYDPEASETFREKFGERVGITYTATNYDALNGADALVVCTEWNSFRQPNLQRMKSLMKQPLIFDGRNIFERKELRKESFTYYPIGRPPVV